MKKPMKSPARAGLKKKIQRSRRPSMAETQVEEDTESSEEENGQDKPTPMKKFGKGSSSPARRTSVAEVHVEEDTESSEGEDEVEVKRSPARTGRPAPASPAKPTPQRQRRQSVAEQYVEEDTESSEEEDEADRPTPLKAVAKSPNVREPANLSPRLFGLAWFVEQLLTTNALA